MRLQRQVLPLEHLEMQGYTIYGERLSDSDPLACPVADLLQTMPVSHIKSMAGNSMHLAAIGCVLMFVLAGTERV